MADLKKLEQFVLEETEEGYAIHMTAEGGAEMAVEVSPEQMDAIIDALDELLSDGEEDLDAEEEDRD